MKHVQFDCKIELINIKHYPSMSKVEFPIALYTVRKLQNKIQKQLFAT